MKRDLERRADALEMSALIKRWFAVQLEEDRLDRARELYQKAEEAEERARVIRDAEQRKKHQSDG